MAALSITSVDVSKDISIAIASISSNSIISSIGVLSDNVSFTVVSLDVTMAVISNKCLTEVHEAWRVEISTVSHPVLLVPLFGLDKGISVGRLVNGSSVRLLVNQSEFGEGSLLISGHHWRLSQVLESHVWVQFRNDVLTLSGSIEHFLVVHACVSKHHVPMILGVEVDKLN